MVGAVSDVKTTIERLLTCKFHFLILTVCFSREIISLAKIIFPSTKEEPLFVKCTSAKIPALFYTLKIRRKKKNGWT